MWLRLTPSTFMRWHALSVCTRRAPPARPTSCVDPRHGRPTWNSCWTWPGRTRRWTVRVHDERRQRLEEIDALDLESDWLEIYRRLTLWELPAEARFGFQLAFYRPLAVPRMAA